ncbi:unnamed protein product [Enterobius vermicularis]|uniref:SNF7 family protein n=1 Tax=Enterobius vermicularis TaxID=51028 RepID=A0A0N4VIS0_ENTVE|nr:unnamed protein product [Enterobius vermicularis]
MEQSSAFSLIILYKNSNGYLLRDVNPVDYDRKITFWTDLIGQSCLGEKNAVFTLEGLKKRFRRGDQIPGSLDVVIADMHKKAEVLTVDELESRDQGWLQWGYSLVRSSFWSPQANTSSIEYVHMPTLRVGFLIVSSKTLTIGVSKTGEEILKFRDASVRGPIQWTESDASVHDMRRAMSKLEREIKRLEEKAKKAEQEARLFLRGGDRNRAAQHLRIKKRALREVEAKDNQYQRLLEIMHQLGQTRQNKDILDAYKAGADAFRSTLERQGVHPDQIDETLDSVSEAMSMANEIRDAIATGVPTDNMDADLEAELAAILGDGKKEEREQVPVGLPEVPEDELVLPASGQNSEEMLKARLQRLREVAH